MDNGGDFGLLVNFVLTHLDSEPLAQRAQLYRAIARFSPRDDERARFNALASDCDAIQTAHDQLVFDFRQRESRRAAGDKQQGDRR